MVSDLILGGVHVYCPYVGPTSLFGGEGCAPGVGSWGDYTPNYAGGFGDGCGHPVTGGDGWGVGTGEGWRITRRFPAHAISDEDCPPREDEEVLVWSVI